MRGPLITRFYTEVIHSRGKGKITSIHGGSRRVFTRSHLPVHPSITRDPKHFSNLIRLLAIQLSQILDVTPRFQSFWAFWALLYCSLLTNLRFCIILPIADNLVSSIFFSLIPPFIPSFLSNVREAIFSMASPRCFRISFISGRATAPRFHAFLFQSLVVDFAYTRIAICWEYFIPLFPYAFLLNLFYNVYVI